MAAFNPCSALKQADKAYFDITTGGGVREVQDQNGERVVYNAANRSALLSYIAALQPQCSTYTAMALGNMRTRPMKFLF